MSVQDTLRRIQEEAKRKAAATLAQFQGPAAKPAPVQAKFDADALQLFRDEVSSALAKAISAKAARNYVGDLVGELQDVAAEKIRLLKSNDMGKNAVRDKDGNVVLYPANCRLFIQSDSGAGAVVIEDQPQLRTIFAGQAAIGGQRGKGSVKQTVRIPLPYLAFIISFQERNGKYYPGGCGIGFRPKPLTSIDDVVYAPMLPHCDPNGNCQPMPIGESDTVVDLVNAYLSIFWNSSFVYAFRPFSIGKTRIKNFQDWQALNNPLDILKANFNGGYSIRALLERYDNGKARSVVGNQVQQHLQGIVRSLTNSIDSDELTDQIYAAAQEIVNTALQNAFAESALQPK